MDSLGHGLYAFINGELAGLAFNQIPFLFLCFFAFVITATIYTGSVIGSYSNPNVSLDVPINLIPGINKIDLLSLTVGLQVQQ